MRKSARGMLTAGKGGRDMKQLVTFLAILTFLSTMAFAHEGAISLYTDASLTSCHQNPFPIFSTTTITMLYIRGDGVDMGSAAAYKIVCTTTDVSFMNVEWEPYIDIPPIGGVPGNVAIAGTSNFGCGQEIVPLGTFDLVNLGDMDTFYVRVEKNSDTFPVPMIIITDCTPFKNEVEVIGGVFVCNDVCNVAVDPKSWGAIKNMYR
jgi:hypothetical protein